jgi:hypothetical protein
MMGDYFWIQLIECKHCGAFETAVDGFEAMCRFLWKKREEPHIEVGEVLPSPAEWLHRILAAMKGSDGE